MAQDYPWLARFHVAHADGVSRPPSYALLLQFALVAILILSASFEAVMQYIGLTLSFFTCLVVIGLLRLRMSEPELIRPFRCPGYPVTPILFLAANAWMLYFLASASPKTAFASLATIISGLAIYAVVPKANSGAH
jgi:basic amino acid/polyamine antiporter, APA family